MPPTGRSEHLFLAVFLAFELSTLFVGSNAGATVVRLDKSTEIKVRLVADRDITSRNLSGGDTLYLVLVEPIVVDDSTIVDVGASGKAVVVESARGKKGGQPGRIKVRFLQLFPKGAFQTEEGEPIKLSGEVVAEGKGKKVLSWMFVFGLFIKGGDGKIETDRDYRANIAETVKLRSR